MPARTSAHVSSVVTLRLKASSAFAFAVFMSPFAHAASASFTSVKALLLPGFEPASDRVVDLVAGFAVVVVLEQEIAEQLEEVAQAELERRHPGLSAGERAELETMLHRIAQKILHPMIRELKAGDEAEADAPALLMN